MDRDYFTIKQLSQYSNIGTGTLYDAIRGREMKHFRIGNKIIIKKVDFEKWFDSKVRETIPERTRTRAKAFKHDPSGFTI